MKIALTLTFLFLLSFLIFPQDIKVDAPAGVSGNSNRWANDIVVLDNAPIGGYFGIQRPNGTIYVVINDTLSTPNLGIIIKTSTDQGHTWQMYPSGITLRQTVNNLKLVRSGLDSIYCFFHFNTNVYCWNIEQPVVNEVFAGNYRWFDAVASSTGNLYVILDSLSTNNIVRYGSTNGGAAWVSRGSISSNAAFPSFIMSTSGDTAVLNYYGPPLADTASSVIRNVRYRETGAGTMASAGSFTDLVPAGELKYEWKTAFRNGEILVVYTKGAVGSRDIYFRKSLDHGATFSTEAPMVMMPTRDENWLDIKGFAAGAGGFDVLYMSDSITAVPNIFTDRLLFTSNQFGSLEIPVPGTQVNDLPFEPSMADLSPKLVELYYSNNDCGVLYAASFGADRKLLWDFLTNIPVELISFTASSVNGEVQLNWSTATETNNKGFEVQRSADRQQNWETIAFLDGYGTTAERNSYSFTDSKVQPGMYSYRLKQIDLGGAFEFSTEVNVEVTPPDDFSLYQNYPNPFNPVTIIKYTIPENNSSIVTLRVYDILGNEVALLVNNVQSSGIHEVSFDASQFSSGTYFYELKSGSFSSVKKMIVIK